jgi:NCS1 family nucleobase:cation symporter-1
LKNLLDTELIETDLSSLEDKKLINEDIAPTNVSQRSWSTYNIAALWVGMSVCIPTYMLASGLIAGGMNWWQALLTIGLGNLIVLIPMVLNAHAGTKYGIPFPVLARASFGTAGSNVPALLRALVACGWSIFIGTCNWIFTILGNECLLYS